jgi:hypothetical protein
MAGGHERRLRREWQDRRELRRARRGHEARAGRRRRRRPPVVVTRARGRRKRERSCYVLGRSCSSSVHRRDRTLRAAAFGRRAPSAALVVLA